jgi:DNA repair protein RadC
MTALQLVAALEPAMSPTDPLPLPAPEPAAARLLRAGSAALSDTEVLAVLIGGGRNSEKPLALAHHLLTHRGGLAALPAASLALLRHSGLRDTQAAIVLAAAELAARLARQYIPEHHVLTRPAELARYLTLHYQRRDQEVLGALFFDQRHGLIGEMDIYRGTLDRTTAEPREILKECFLRGAAGVALFHTHPSGDPTPSANDWHFTKRLKEAADLLGIEFMDHIVLGATGRWASLSRRGAW